MNDYREEFVTYDGILYKFTLPINPCKVNIINNHYCYLLQSLNSHAKKKIYFGYTVNPSRRLRQHNREIQGGAKKTAKGVPWQMIFYIGGFPDERTALQFEWKINREIWKRRIRSVTPAIDVIYYVLGLSRWCKNSIDPATLTYIFNWLPSLPLVSGGNKGNLVSGGNKGNLVSNNYEKRQRFNFIHSFHNT